jgi:hypothetical protein
VIVNLEDNYLRFEGEATLIAKGTATDKIVFNGKGSQATISTLFCNPWNQQTSSGSIIEYAVFNMNSFSASNIKVVNSEFNCSIAVNSDSNGIFSNNNVNAPRFLAAGTAKISHNTINSDVEIDSFPTVEYNAIKGDVSFSGSDNSRQILAYNTIDGDIIQFHGSPTISHNTINGEVKLSGEPSTVYSNTIYGGISVSDVQTAIQNNKIIGAQVGIGIGAIYKHLDITISENSIINCNKGISAAPNYASGGRISLAIKGNLIKGNNYGINLDSDVDAVIQNNLIDSNKFGVLYGKTIEHNTIVNNDIGVASFGTITYNNFENNNYSVSIGHEAWTSSSINVNNNWWGTTDEQAIGLTLYDNKYNFELGTIQFKPYLTSPDTQAPSKTYTPPDEPTEILEPSPNNSPTPTPTLPSTTKTPTPPPTQAQTSTPLGENTQIGPDLTQIIIVSVIVIAVVSVCLNIVLFRRRKR